MDEQGARFVASIRMPEQSRIASDAISFAANGDVLHFAEFRSAPTALRQVRRSTIDSKGIVTAVDTIGVIADFPIKAEIVREVRGGVSKHSIAQPFGGLGLYASGPRGQVATAVSSSYDVELRAAAGNVVARIRRDETGPRLSRRERDSAEQMITGWAAGRGASRASVKLNVPQTKAIISDIGFDLDGRLWIERSVVDGTPRRADVYSSNGAFQASYEWPANVRLLSWAIRGTDAIGVEYDADGVASIVRLKFP